MISTGFTLRQLREIYGLKQWYLASKLGYSSSFLCDIEKGRKPLTPELKQKAEEIFREYQAKDHSNDSRFEEIIEVSNV